MYTDDTNFNFTDSSDDAVVNNSQNDIAIEKKKQNTTRRKRVVVSKDDAINDLSEYSKNMEPCEVKREESESKNTEFSPIGFVNNSVAFNSDVGVVESNENVVNSFTAVDNSYVSDSDDLLDKDSQNGLSDVKINIAELKEKTIQELLEIGEGISADVTNAMPKKEIIMNILKTVSFNQGTVIGSGTVEILPDGFGFLRSSDANYITCFSDIYISSNQIRKFNFKVGDVVTGMARAPKRGERYFALQRVVDVNGCGVKLSRYRPNFDDLVPQYPVSRINLEIEGDKNSDISSRVVDLVAPLGKGQRALIVAPPRTGKTVLMQNIAHSIAVNHPEIELIVLLIDERPEEVTDMLRSVKGEVVSSTFDEPATRHVQLADIVIEKAKRMVECGKDVVILLDSLTRLARAYNTVIPSSGKVLTGGVDSNALQRPKRFFGAARNIEQGGSLTIIATALIETGSRMDDVIFEEFKGTGNSEIILDRKIADKRIFPAIDITRSGTRKEELLMDRNVLAKLWVLRRILTQMAPLEAMEFLRDKIKNTKNNHEFFNLMNN